MKYTQPSFSVNPSDAKAPKDCRHGWIDAKRKCVLCGTPDIPVPPRPVIRRSSVHEMTTPQTPATEWTTADATFGGRDP